MKVSDKVYIKLSNMTYKQDEFWHLTLAKGTVIKVTDNYIHVRYEFDKTINKFINNPEGYYLKDSKDTKLILDPVAYENEFNFLALRYQVVEHLASPTIDYAKVLPMLKQFAEQLQLPVKNFKVDI